MTPDPTTAATAIWLGILTSISPCPLATNVAAVSFLGRDVERPLRVAAGGVAYAVGRAATYVGLAAALLTGLLAAPSLSITLQRAVAPVLGPLLIASGLVLLGWVPLPVPDLGGRLARLRERAASWGVAGAALLGAIFALSFCPVSAALYFGSLLPLAASAGDGVVLPALYGAGTALPVALLAGGLVFGVNRVAAAARRLETCGRWAERITAVVFIAVGLLLLFD